ncbi:MAG: hypothetical protein GX333_09760 [Syntrophomonadaceae bacterium]|nr:hypothetical protein [Syntrophomonadaceae bacterium]
MELIRFTDFKLTERNKAIANMFFDHNGNEVMAQFIFYLQRDECLGIRVGRHDGAVPTVELENYINKNKPDLKKLVKPEVVRVKAERLQMLASENS